MRAWALVPIAATLATLATACVDRPATGNPIPPCRYEDSGNTCFWNAKKQGNGIGDSFLVLPNHAGIAFANGTTILQNGTTIDRDNSVVQSGTGDN